MSDSNTVKAPTLKWTALLIAALTYSQLNFLVTKITIPISDQLQLQNFDFIVNFIINKVVKFIMLQIFIVLMYFNPFIFWII